MSGIKFRPGETARVLDRRARESGLKKAALMRKLIEEAPAYDDDCSKIYARITELGNALKAACEIGDFRNALKIAREIWDNGKKLSRCASSAKPTEYKKDGLVNISMGKAMTFRPRAQEGKLRKLSEMSGLSIAVVLRMLICGYKLPNEMAWRANSRLASLGGLIKYLCASLPDNMRTDFWKLGVEIGEIASAGLVHANMEKSAIQR